MTDLVMAIYRFWADVVVVLHAAWAGFIVFGLVLILLGAVRRWRWVTNFWFRLVHLLMIGFVVAESLLGLHCPLTTLENNLRDLAGDETYPGSFIGYWVNWLLFYHFSEGVLTCVYSLFGLLVIAAIFVVPPRRPWRGQRQEGERRVRKGERESGT
jgi:hypothetical protein